MFAGIRAFSQALANGFMETPVTITNRLLVGQKDPTNPYGDDTVDWEPTSVVVNGWYVNALSKSTTSIGGMDTVVEEDTIRLPIGTVVRQGAKMTINGHDWTAVDVSDDETWPAMLKVSVSRISGD